MKDDAPSILDLHDIVLPDPVPAWPPAPLFWWVAGLAAVIAALLAWRYVAARRRNAYRRAGLALLVPLAERLGSPGAEVGVVRDVSTILKRVALAAFPRELVAPLAGAEWLGFLDSTIGGREFTEGPGAVLPRATFAGGEVTTAEARDLLSIAGRWIRRHRVEGAAG